MIISTATKESDEVIEIQSIDGSDIIINPAHVAYVMVQTNAKNENLEVLVVFARKDSGLQFVVDDDGYAQVRALINATEETL